MALIPPTNEYQIYVNDATGEKHLVKINASNGTVTDVVKIASGMVDPLSGALQVATIAEHEIHAGEAYTHEVVATGGSGTKATITFKTPNTTKWIHMLIQARCNVEAHYTLGEGPTITDSTGTNVSPISRNRNAITDSGLIGTRTAAVNKVTEGATVSGFGTVLEEVHFGNSKVGGENRGTQEWILKQNTTYAVETESEAASSDVMIELDWYEHVSVY